MKIVSFFLFIIPFSSKSVAQVKKFRHGITNEVNNVDAALEEDNNKP
jgi:hypothetical protein